MTTITTRSGKGSPLTNTEVDNNFINLNTAKYESGDTPNFTGGMIGTNTGADPLYIARSNGSTSQALTIKVLDSDVVLTSVQDEASGANFQFKTTNATVTDRSLLDLTYNAGTIFNEDGAGTQDFRIEGSSNNYAFFVDGGTSRTYVGGYTGSRTFNVVEDTQSGGNGQADVAIVGPNDGWSALFFARTNDSNPGGIYYKHSDELVYFRVNNTNSYYMKGGNFGIGTDNPVGTLDLGNATGGRGIAWGGTDGTSHYGSIWSEYGTASIIIGAGLKGSTTNADFIYPYTGNYGYAAIELDSYSDDGIKFYTAADGARTKDTVATKQERMRITTGGNFIFNDAGSNNDFRVESNTNSNMLLVDGADDTVSIGTPAAANSRTLNVLESINFLDTGNNVGVHKVVKYFTRAAAGSSGAMYLTIGFPRSGVSYSASFNVVVSCYNGWSGVGSSTRISQQLRCSKNSGDGMTAELGETTYNGSLTYFGVPDTVTTNSATMTVQIPFPDGSNTNGNNVYSVEIDAHDVQGRGDITYTLS